MRKLILAVALAVLLVPAVHAQQDRETQDAAEKREKAALDRQYRNALKNLPPSAQPKNDPWAQMRAPTPLSAPKK